MSKSYSSGKIDRVMFEDMKLSEEAVGQIYPVVNSNEQGKEKGI